MPNTRRSTAVVCRYYILGEWAQLACENGRYGPFCDDTVMSKTNEQTRKEMREQLSRWWAHKKLKAARMLGRRADKECGTSQTDSHVRQRGSKLWLLQSGALTLLLTTWWTGFLNEYLWPPERVVLSIENVLWGPPPQPEDRFRVVLCWLENDKSGDDTQIVEQAFRSVSGIELVRSALSIRASGAADDWQPAMQEGAADVLEAWDADLAIVGLVKQSRQVLSLWFIPRTGEGTLDRGDLPYKLEDVTLGEDFHDDFDAQLVAVTLASMSITEDTDEMLGRALDQWLREARRNLVALLRSSAIDQPDRRARLQEVLGIVLLRLGELEGGTERLEEAVAAHRAALEEFTREQTPFQWAEIQNNLGRALWILGELEGDTERLEEAVKAHESALEGYTRELAPLEWARTQNLLGTAFTLMSGGRDDTGLLEQAVIAYRAALEETRERAPLNWAETQNYLGLVLLGLGEREDDTERLVEAVEAHRAALEEYARGRVPPFWALTQNNLGNALRILGELEGDTKRLEEAVEAHRAALEEFNRERVPFFWALTQNNLGNALRILGEREGDTERLEEAVEAHRAALGEYTRERAPLDWAETQNYLGLVLLGLGEREGDMERLEEAVEAHRAALEEYTRERVPLAWALTQNNLGNALRILGEREGGTERLEEAAAAYRAALEEYTRQPNQLESARRTQNNLDSVLHTLNERLAAPGDATGLGFGIPPGWATVLAC